ncbi:hypothetical protein SAPIO_CDS4130 [Scedosporium apiospermum]|uniref:Uncharacterized protein n=1 Tax=Pseudallescheria apiosperma TaxID=563466 RepID=A0A084G9C5_PSEDA|nr:uncharacterized protein SAPIO_CDS4130 [Scedosporium apiospermum]KEZ43937.1 hypothetical protein SAPIO_CDS4130 [Scedosporium apiospermum]
MSEEFLDILTADALRFDEYAEESKDHSGRARSVRVTGSSRPSSTAVKQSTRICDSVLLKASGLEEPENQKRIRIWSFPLSGI